MSRSNPSTLRYQRCRFRTALPTDRQYTSSHYWLVREEAGVWRVGLTKWGTRMLGEIVEWQLDLLPGAQIGPGHVLGWIEGFKAIVDVMAVGDGTLASANPLLRTRISNVNNDPYGSGWLYSFKGKPAPATVKAKGYAAILDAAIDQILEARAS